MNPILRGIRPSTRPGAIQSDVPHFQEALAVLANDAAGDAGLIDLSTGPVTSPTRIPSEAEAEAVRLRTVERLSGDELASRIGVSAKTGSRIVARTACHRCRRSTG